MNRLTPRLLCSLVAVVLLPISGFGQMDPAVAVRLQQSIDALNAKIDELQNPSFPPHLHRGPYDAQAVTANESFLRNLRQLRTNLIYLWQAANAPTGHLDVATIGAYLHTGLQQSAFTDANGAHAAGSADIPGKSVYGKERKVFFHFSSPKPTATTQ